MNVNVWDVNEHIQALIRSRRADQGLGAARPRHSTRIARRAIRRRRQRRPREREPAHALHAEGVSIWLDTLSRELLDSGEFATLIRDYAVTGATSNPTIFAKAITGSDLYDEQLRALAADGERDPRSCSSSSRSRTSGAAARELRPIYDDWGASTGSSRSNAPLISPTTREATIAQACELWRRLDPRT